MAWVGIAVGRRRSRWRRLGGIERRIDLLVVLSLGDRHPTIVKVVAGAGVVLVTGLRVYLPIRVSIGRGRLLWIGRVVLRLSDRHPVLIEIVPSLRIIGVSRLGVDDAIGMGWVLAVRLLGRRGWAWRGWAWRGWAWRGRDSGRLRNAGWVLLQEGREVVKV